MKNFIELHWCYYGDGIAVGASGKCGLHGNKCNCEIPEIAMFMNVLYNFNACLGEPIELGPRFQYVCTGHSQLNRALRAYYSTTQGVKFQHLSKENRSNKWAKVIRDAEIFANTVIADMTYSDFLKEETISLSTVVISKHLGEEIF